MAVVAYLGPIFGIRLNPNIVWQTRAKERSDEGLQIFFPSLSYRGYSVIPAAAGPACRVSTFVRSNYLDNLLSPVV